MGCDIHMYVEYKHYDRWVPFGGRINPGRNYEVFSVLAGVRGEQPEGLVAPRGFPTDASYEAEGDNMLYVCEDKDYHDHETWTSRSKAEKWVASGSSQWATENKKYVTHPAWHSHSWLTTKEFEEALLRLPDPLESYVPYHALLEAMKVFEAQNMFARVVFWFDN